MHREDRAQRGGHGEEHDHPEDERPHPNQEVDQAPPEGHPLVDTGYIHPQAVDVAGEDPAVAGNAAHPERHGRHNSSRG